MDLIKKEIGADNIKSALSLLVDHLSLDENSYRKEIESLTNEVYVLKNKVKTLEKINSSLLKDRNYNLVKEYSLTLIDLIDSNKLKEVKEIIEKHEFPINEYLTLAENYSHLTLLHIAVENDLNDFVRYLVEKGADVNIPDKIDLWTPLMFAVQKQNIDLVKYLIKRGSDINIKDIVIIKLIFLGWIYPFSSCS